MRADRSGGFGDGRAMSRRKKDRYRKARNTREAITQAQEIERGLKAIYEARRGKKKT